METAVGTRGIKHLLHFTRIENLESILANGIIPRANLVGTNAIFNDDFRWDNQEGASCFSITFPNYKMFYTLRQKDTTKNWVVIACHASILWEKDCAFCITNAANTSVTSIPIQSRKGKAAFLSLFNDIPNKPTRSQLGIKDYLTTDPQAEVLVFDTVEPSYIAAVCCQNSIIQKELSSLHPGIPIKVASSLYNGRCDYGHWR